MLGTAAATPALWDRTPPVARGSTRGGCRPNTALAGSASVAAVDHTPLPPSAALGNPAKPSARLHARSSARSMTPVAHCSAWVGCGARGPAPPPPTAPDAPCRRLDGGGAELGRSPVPPSSLAP